MALYVGIFIKQINNLIYANDGDWVESLTALVEHKNGDLEIIDWSGLGHLNNSQVNISKIKELA